MRCGRSSSIAKNALFAGCDEGAENWALLASLIETCKLNGVSAEHWLADVLAKLINGWPASRLDELLPWASTYTMHAQDSEAGGMSPDNTTAVRIKVTLKDVKPEVMRRLVVPVTLRLDRLHLTLQAAFGWTNSHLFEFFAGEAVGEFLIRQSIYGHAHRCPQGAALRYRSRDRRQDDPLSL